MNKQYNKILLKEEKLLQALTSNFDKKTSGFKTVGRGFNNFETYKFRLGAVKVDIAKSTLSTKPQESIKRLSEATIIFKQLGREKELSFAQNLLIKLKEN